MLGGRAENRSVRLAGTARRGVRGGPGCRTRHKAGVSDIAESHTLVSELRTDVGCERVVLVQERFLGNLQRCRELTRSHLIRSDLPACSAACSTTGPTRTFGSHHLASNAATMGSLTDGRENRADRIDHTTTGFRVGEVHRSLDHVIGKRVPEHLLQLVRSQHLINHLAAHLVIRSSQTLLNHVGAELLLGQSGNVTAETLAQGLREMRFSKIENVLNNVVTEWVLDKVKGISSDLRNEASTLFTRGVVDAPLEDTASMAMGSNDNAVSTNGVVNELSVLGRKTIKAFLDDMVAIQILHEVHNAVPKSTDHSLRLLWSRDELDHLLESAGSVLVERDLHKLWRRVVDQSSTLLIVGILKELLAQIVTKWIWKRTVSIM